MCDRYKLTIFVKVHVNDRTTWKFYTDLEYVGHECWSFWRQSNPVSEILRSRAVKISLKPSNRKTCDS